ncbi:MAG: cell envelope integrity protein TolA, partial [Gammaproteobacteria bacterium]
AEKRQKEAAERAAAEKQRRQQEEAARLAAEQRRREAAEKAAAEKAAAEKKRQEEEAARQKAEAERKAEAAKQAAQLQNAMDKAMKDIKRKVTNAWIRPVSIKTGLKCVIAVKVISGGEVMSAKVTTSSGDELFDRSAENAVRKASPLPIPTELSKEFRTFTFVFKPE